jgi:hypothetical protein
MGFGSIVVPLFMHIFVRYDITFGSLLVWRIGIWGDGFETTFGGLQQFRDWSVGL